MEYKIFENNIPGINKEFRSALSVIFLSLHYYLLFKKNHVVQRNNENGELIRNVIVRLELIWYRTSRLEEVFPNKKKFKMGRCEIGRFHFD